MAIEQKAWGNGEENMADKSGLLTRSKQSVCLTTAPREHPAKN